MKASDTILSLDITVKQMKLKANNKDINKLIKVRGKLLHGEKLTKKDMELLQAHQLTVN